MRLGSAVQARALNRANPPNGCSWVNGEFQVPVDEVVISCAAQRFVQCIPTLWLKWVNGELQVVVDEVGVSCAGKRAEQSKPTWWLKLGHWRALGSG